MNDLGNASIGIENQDGTVGVQVAHREYYVEDNMPILFREFLAPSELMTTVVNSTQIDLTWTDNTTSEDNFVLERSVNDTSNFSALDTLLANVTSYSDLTVTDVNSYFYKVIAINATEQSNYSNMAVGYSGSDTRMADSLALVSFYYATGGSNWTDASGWLTDTLESWFGVSIVNGRVIALDLSFNNLRGDFPISVLDLDSLEHLHLGSNMLKGDIPAAIGDLSAMLTLQLQQNQFGGIIPPEITNLSNLTELFMYQNQFSGSLPVGIGTLLDLQTLNLSYNQLSGSILTEITDLTQLTELNLGNNQLTGSIPALINNLTNLTNLYLGDNKLSGSIPTEIAVLSLLQWLDLSTNEFTGSLDTSIIAMPNMLFAQFQNNKIDSIPDIRGVGYSLFLTANNLDFNDLEPNAGTSASISTQNPFGVEIDTVVSEGATITFTADPGGTDNSYQWMRSDRALPDDTLATLTFSSISKDMAGRYYCLVTNNILGMDIVSESFELAVNEPTSFSAGGTGSIVTNTNASFKSAWGDYDNDGFQDLFVPNDGNNALYKNNGDGTFTEIAVGSIVTDGGASNGAAWADYDNDGYLDLFVANDSAQNNFLYQNNGDGTFTKITTGPVVTDGGYSTSGAWGDYNLDGYVDLFVTNGGFNVNENNFLYENNGDGTFTKITTGSIVNSGGRSTHAVWGNFYHTGYRKDKLPDLYVTNEAGGSGQDNFMYVNMDNGLFISEMMSPAVKDGADSYYAIIGSFSQSDGMDIFVCNGMGQNNMIFVPIGGGMTEFMPVEDMDAVTDGGNSYSATYGDYDNDGNFDLYVSNAGEANFLYQNKGMSLGASKISTGPMVTDIDDSFGANWIDIDNDGQLELFVANGGTVGGNENRIYNNAGNANNWLTVRLEGNASNAKGIGSIVKVQAAGAGSLEDYSPVFEISSDPGGGLEAHIGIQDYTDIGLLSVQWPSGNASFEQLPSLNQVMTITEETVTPTYQSAGWLETPSISGSTENPLVAFDSIGYLYVAGTFTGSILFGNDTLTAQGGDGYDHMFIAKYDTSGTALWGIQTTGANPADVDDIQFTSNGSILSVTGYFHGTVDFGDGSPLTPVNTKAVFTATYDLDGNLLSVGTAETTGDAYMSGITMDDSDNVYITGQFYLDLDFGGPSLSDMGGYLMFIAKYYNGNYIWADNPSDTSMTTYMDESSLTCDNNGNLYMIGDFYQNFPATIDFGNGVTILGLGVENLSQIYLVKYDTAGLAQWAITSDNGPNFYGLKVVIDQSGNPVMSGIFSNTMIFGGNQLYGGEYGNIFLIKVDPSGIVQWIKQSISGAELYVLGLDISANDDIIVSGAFYGTHQIEDQQIVTSALDDDSYASFFAEFDGTGNLNAFTQNLYFEGSLNFVTGAAYSESDEIYVAGVYEGDLEFAGGQSASNFGEEHMFLTKLGPFIPQDIQIDAADSLALVDLYNATDGANWTNNTNWLTDTVDTWYGITVTNGRVEQIDLTVNNLIGGIPSSIGNLTALTELHLGQNFLGDSIPPEIGNLINLTNLDLTASQVGGALPPEIGSLSSLVYLNLGNNAISGEIPAEIGNLTNVANIHLYNNLLTGSIPTEIANMSSLADLELYGNDLEGEIPISIGNLTNLSILYVHNNKLSGIVPDSLGTITNLDRVNLSDNEFTYLPNLSSTNIIALYVQNNNLGFEHLESNMSITTFFYVPQDTVGTETDTLLQAGQDITLDLTIPGTTNQYQWYKDDVTMTGENAATLELTAVTFEDQAYYTADVTSTIVTGLTLKQYPVHLKVSSLESDSLALESLYLATDGSNWTDNSNWLTGDIDQWYGITIANDRVQSVKLGGNNLSGIIPDDILDMIQTDTLDFSDNVITAIPDFTLIPDLSLLDVSDNYLGFEELEPNVTVSGIQYSPQKDLPGNPDDTVYVSESYQFEALTYSPNNTYKWTFNDVDITGATDSIYQITTMEKDSIGDYQAVITNSVVTGLEIRTEKARLWAIASLFGYVTYQDEPVTSGEMRLLKINATGGFDTTNLAPIQTDGSYEISNVILDDYMLVADAADTEFADLIPTYYGETIYWEEADTIPLSEDITLIDIPFFEEPVETTGDGSLSGTVEEELEVNGRILGRRKVNKATVTIKKVAGEQRTLKTLEDDVVAVAYTDENGQFLMPKLEAGTYDFNVQYPGIPMDESTFTTITIGEEEANRDVQVMCTVTLDGIIVEEIVETGLNDELAGKYRIYPNPADLSVVVENTEFKGVMSKIILMDVNGRMILDEPFIIYERRYLDVGILKNGVYILKILDRNNEPIGTSRILISR